MVYSFVFNNGLSSLLIQNDGGSFDYTKFQGSKIIGRRRFTSATDPRVFEATAEPADLPISNIPNLDTLNLYFFVNGDVQIFDSTNPNVVDPVYSPVNVNNSAPIFSTSSTLPDGLGFQFIVSGSSLKIETTGTPNSSFTPIEVTFTVPYLRVGDTSTQERWVATAQFTTSVFASDQVARSGTFTSSEVSLKTTTPTITFVDVTFEFKDMTYDGYPLADGDADVFLLSADPNIPPRSIVNDLGGTIIDGTGLVTFSIPPFQTIDNLGLTLAYRDGFSGYVQQNQYTLTGTLDLSAKIVPVPLTNGGYRVYINELKLGGFELPSGQEFTILFDGGNSGSLSYIPWSYVYLPSMTSLSTGIQLAAVDRVLDFSITPQYVGQVDVTSVTGTTATIVLPSSIDRVLNGMALLAIFNPTSVRIKNTATGNDILTTTQFSVGSVNTYNLTGLIPESFYQQLVVYSTVTLEDGVSSVIDIAEFSITTTSVNFSAVIDLVVTGTSLTAGMMNITLSASNVRIDGNFVDPSDTNLVVVYPVNNTTVEIQLTTMGNGEINTTFEIPARSYSDGEVYLAYRTPGASNIYATNTFSLESIVYTSSDTLTADITTTLVTDGSYILNISNVVYNGNTVTSDSFVIQLSKGSIDISYDSQTIGYGPYELDAATTYTLTYMNGSVTFTTGGSSGGGGGNNGGNGHNNMSTLTFNPAYQVDASYEESVVVYGETAVTRPDYTDALAVSASKTELDAILSFTKDGNAAAADFSVSLDGIKAKVKSALEARLTTLRPLPTLASMGIDARSILSHTEGAWDADVAALADAQTGDAARNVYEQAADKGKLSASDGKLNLAVGDTFVFYMNTTATQSLEISIDSGVFTGATASDVVPLIPLADLFGAGNAAGTKGTITKSFPYKFAVTVTVA